MVSSILNERMESIKDDLRRSFHRSKKYMAPILDAVRIVSNASLGSWPEDPIFDIKLRIGSRDLTLPIQAISKMVAEKQAIAYFEKFGEIIDIYRFNTKGTENGEIRNQSY